MIATLPSIIFSLPQWNALDHLLQWSSVHQVGDEGEDSWVNFPRQNRAGLSISWSANLGYTKFCISSGDCSVGVPSCLIKSSKRAPQSLPRLPLPREPPVRLEVPWFDVCGWVGEFASGGAAGGSTRTSIWKFSKCHEGYVLFAMGTDCPVLLSGTVMLTGTSKTCFVGWFATAETEVETILWDWWNNPLAARSWLWRLMVSWTPGSRA